MVNIGNMRCVCDICGREKTVGIDNPPSGWAEWVQKGIRKNMCNLCLKKALNQPEERTKGIIRKLKNILKRLLKELEKLESN